MSGMLVGGVYALIGYLVLYIFARTSIDEPLSAHDKIFPGAIVILFWPVIICIWVFITSILFTMELGEKRGKQP